MTDVQETGAEVVVEKGSIDHLGVLKEDTFDYTVPSDSPVVEERGKKYEGNPLTHREISTKEDAYEVIRIKEWDIVDMVNKLLKGNGRSNAYQAKMAPHKPVETDPEKMFETSVRGMIKQGIPEAMARELLKNTLAQVKG